ncbi:uncharacterized protein MKZ38_010450 [Zalerion maritima]|uniref:MIP18 family-like domain-containing protein n=1 Tax=Zalerion maritima TaxID=339359 RepID=A0AAD5RFY0_9PEZI|nr:uncharacterized protein MKZ38_010450 [Zalerion maritima]
MADIQNANPTILNASQLPTRHLKQVAVRFGPEAKYSRLVFNRNGPWSENMSGDSSEDSDTDELACEPIDEQEIYDLISPISDPEHPVSLGQLSVVNLPDIHIEPPPSSGMSDPNKLVQVIVDVTPTINHCSLATVIGLGVRVRLEQALPPNYRVHVRMKDGTHAQDDQVSKQLADKERVCAALENETLKATLNKMLETCA